MMQKGDVTVRKAVVDDVKDIHALLMQAALKGQLLPRALTYLYGHVRNFFVLVKPDGEIVGCVALAPVWEDLAEVASLVIREDQRGKGLGLLAVQACLADCPSIGIKRSKEIDLLAESLLAVSGGNVEVLELDVEDHQGAGVSKAVRDDYADTFT